MSPRSAARRLAAEAHARRRRFLADLVERTGRTAVQAAAAGWLIDRDFSVHGLEVAGTAAVIALVTCMAAQKAGAKDSASFLPADVDPPQGDAS